MKTSPLLFNIFLEDMGEHLKAKGLKAIFFADDVVGIAQNRVELQNIIDTIEEACYELKLKINKKKSGVMRIYKRKVKIKENEQIS